MLSNRSRIILILIFVIALYVLYKALFQERSSIVKYTNKIEGLKQGLSGLEEELSLYNKEYDKDTLYIIMPESGEEFRSLLSKRFVLRRELASVYKEYGDYFLDELYRVDVHAPVKYRNLAFNVTGQEFKYIVKQGTDKGNRLFDFMLETRKKALDIYDKASLTVSDFASEYYKLKSTSGPFIYPLGIEYVFIKGDVLNERLFDGERLSNGLLNKYLLKYVSPSLHYKKGKAYRQLSNLFFLRGDLGGVSKNISYAEREYLITLLVDKVFWGVYYDLAELYVFSFKNLDGLKKSYNLKKSEFLLQEVLSKGLLSASQTKKILFLLGETYYLLSLLSPSDKQMLMKLYASDYTGVSLKGFSFSYLQKARSIYRDKLLIMLPEGSPSYKNAFDNYLRIEKEMGSGL